MRRVSEYVKFPGHCLVTGSSDTSHGVLDLEHDRDFDGACYLSGKLVEEAAHMWGFTSPEKTLELIEERDAAVRQVSELSAILEGLDEMVAVNESVSTALTKLKAAVAA